MGGATGDALALGLDGSKWAIAAQGGGCLGGSTAGGYTADARAFAVALAKPALPVPGCPAGLCVIALHSPHINITRGSATVERVCGAARRQCTVAMGDWNAAIKHPPGVPSWEQHTVAKRWQQLVRTPPTFSAAGPDVNTCCYPETKYSGVDDHLVTDIVGAELSSAKALGYQLKFSADTEEHMPIAVKLTLPATERPAGGSVSARRH